MRLPMSANLIMQLKGRRGRGAPHANMITFPDACIYILNPRSSSPQYADASQALDHLIYRLADKDRVQERGTRFRAANMLMRLNMLHTVSYLRSGRTDAGL